MIVATACHCIRHSFLGRGVAAQGANAAGAAQRSSYWHWSTLGIIDFHIVWLCLIMQYAIKKLHQRPNNTNIYQHAVTLCCYEMHLIVHIAECNASVLFFSPMEDFIEVKGFIATSSNPINSPQNLKHVVETCWNSISMKCLASFPFCRYRATDALCDRWHHFIVGVGRRKHGWTWVNMGEPVAACCSCQVLRVPPLQMPVLRLLQALVHLFTIIGDEQIRMGMCSRDAA